MKGVMRLTVVSMVITVLSACSSTPPASTAPQRMIARTGVYVVQKGDTLYSIARRSGRTTQELVAWNKLSSAHQIEVGQELVMAPPAGTKSAATTTTAPRAPATPAATQTSKSKATAAANAEKINWMWPTSGPRKNSTDKNKKGVDIAGTSGQPIVAAAAGRVIYAGRGIRGYGDMIIIKHSNAWLSVYAHNKALMVKEGQNVNRGEKIAEMGNTDSSSVKLYFELRRNGDPLNPTEMMPK
jgi:lipoprotein NlpD